MVIKFLFKFHYFYVTINVTIKKFKIEREMNKSNNLVVVGIGSSAGGLEALQTMLSSLPEISNCSVIIAQHLSPTHKSMMVDLLSRSTNIPVIEVKNGLKIKPKTIYMTPENTDIYVKDSKLYLKTVEQAFGPKPSVNYFFSSLARNFNERAIGVILSGTGSDGAYGIRAIKAEGGITIAQSPTTAKYDGMPLSAINTGKVDLVVPIEKLGQEISNIVETIDNRIELSLNDRVLGQIHRILFNKHGVDFSLYKKNTIIRRIERRIAALKKESLQEYLTILESSEEETTNLYHDILIGVTSFFRDIEAFEALEKYIQGMLAKKEQGEEIRFWSIGCSTGEEAYTLAIILTEILQEKISKYKIKIFATDIDDEALKIARSGIYSETSLEGIDSKLIKKYFSIQKNQFEVKKTIRELVVFSKHNIISDSPFLRIDLITCRNMLIYFSNNLQNKFFPLIHYSLVDGGLLFLGKSESINQNIDLFSTQDSKAKIFKSQFTGIKEPPKLFNYSTTLKGYPYNENKRSKNFKNEEEYIEEVISEAVTISLLDKCAVINPSYDIVYIKGNIPFLKHKSGKISNNLFRQLDDDLSLDLRSCLNEVFKSKKSSKTPFRAVNLYEDIIRYVRVIVIPTRDEKSDDWLYVLFFQTEESQDIKGHIISDGDDNEIIEKLSLELDSTKTHLQNVIEELETSYEEMQSLNEELQSSNEELQSSNEELETTNEELQSTNEELQTAYSELRVLYEDKEKRTKQLEDLTIKLNVKTEEYRKQKELTEGILDTAPIAITLVNYSGQIVYANSYAENLFELSKKEILDRVYNSPKWNMQDFEGKELTKKYIPFDIIKSTYEPVHDIKLAMEIKDKKKYLSVSGTPQFDYEGVFQGAVFCIEDLTSSITAQENINYYKDVLDSNNYNLDNNANFDSRLMDLALLELNISIKNFLNDLSLEISTYKGNNTSSNEIIEISNKKVEEITNYLDEKVNFYTKRIHYDRTSINDGLKDFSKFYEPILYNDNVTLSLDLNIKAVKLISFKSFYNSLYFIFDLILKIYNIDEQNNNKKLSIKTTSKSDIQFFIQLNEKTIDNEKFKSYIKELEEFVSNSGNKIEIESNEFLIFQLKLK